MRKYVFTLLIGLVLFPAGIFCQNLLLNPEHIAYDAMHQRYLVTNYGNGTIVSIDQAGTQRVVLTGLPECMGIHIQDTVLMVSFGKKIRFFDLSTLRQFREVTLNTTTWLDGMITDNHRNVYAVESGGKIFKISLDTFEATTLITAGIPQYAQDLAFDPENNRLIVVAWAINSPIKAVDLNNNTVTTLVTTQLGNFDGVVRDSLGNLFVSCHRNGGKIYRIDQSLQKAPTVVATGLQSPAGICLNDTDNVLAIPDFDGNAVTFLSGIYPEIKFQKSQQILGDSRVFGIAIADVDGDGDNDIFLTNYIGPSKLWLNNGNGIFSVSNQNFGNSEAHDVAIADFNSDGYPDIFLLNHAAPCKVFFNDGKGIFTDSGQNIGSIDENPGVLVCGDVDRDGDLDAVIVYYQKPIKLWINDGKGGFTVRANQSSWPNGGALALADINGDHNPDLFICLSDKPDEIWFGDGTGNFSDSGQKLGNSTGYEKVDSGDINGDGYVDFVTANSIDGIKIWFNQNGSGRFVEAGPYFERGYGLCKLFDADLDGDLDLFISGVSGAKILVSDGKGHYTQGQVLDEKWISRIACGKLDNNNDLDIVLGKREGTGGNTIYFNESLNHQFSKKPYLGQTPPGMTPEKFAPDIVSSQGLREFSLTLSSDSTEVYFYRFNENVPSKLYFSRFENGSWTVPAVFEPSAAHPASEPCMTPDNQRLYFMWDTGESIFPTYYKIDRTRTGWSDPVKAGEGMYMTSTDDGELYTTDISTLMTNGKTYLSKVSAAQGVFTRLNRIQVLPHYGSQAHPCIARDSSYLIFDVDGGQHLFVSFRKSNGTWDSGIDLTNHGFDIKAGGAYISPDGKYLFFHQSGDIWWVDIRMIEDLNPFTGGIDKSSGPGFELYQNTPNPFQTYTRIAFSLDQPGNISLDVYNNLGLNITHLIRDQYYPPGRHEIDFNNPKLKPGIYNYTLSSAFWPPQTRKMVIIQ